MPSASVFVLVNRSLLEPTWSWLGLACFAVALALFNWAVFFLSRYFGPMQRPLANPLLVYLGAVAFEIALIFAGSLLLDRWDLLELRPVLIVLAVGLHFLPLDWVFRLPLFMRLAVIMSLLGAVGLVLGATVDRIFSPTVAVVTGIVMLLVIAHDAWATRAGSRSESERLTAATRPG